MPPATDSTPKSSSPLAHSIDGILGARLDAAIMADNTTANSVDDLEGSSGIVSPAERMHSCEQEITAPAPATFVSTTGRPRSDGRHGGGVIPA